MKTKFLKRLLSWTFLLGVSSGAMAQNNLPLVAEVDFSAKGEDDAYYISTDMVDGIGNSVLPADLTTSMKLIDSTAANDKKSTFLDNTRYAITTNPVRLDSVRMADTGDGEWGFVVSGGKMGFNNQRAFTYTIGGLKNNGRYRVEVEYCNPLGVDYLNTSGSNKKPHLSSGYSAQIKIGTNASNMNPDGVQTTSLAGKSGSCLVASISNPLQPSGTQGPIAGGKLKVDVVISQLPAGQAIMIKGIKVILAKTAVRVCPANGIEPGFTEQTPDEVGGFHGSGQKVPFLDLPVNLCAPFSNGQIGLKGCLFKGFIKRKPPGGNHPYGLKVMIGEIKRCLPEGSQQRNILMHVVNHVQKGEKNGDLRQSVIIHRAVIIHGNVKTLEDFHHSRRVGVGAPKKNGDIPVLDGLFSLCIAGKELRNLFSRRHALCLKHLQRCGGRITLRPQQNDLCGPVTLFIRPQRVPLLVIQFIDRAVHGHGEDLVHAVNDTG